MDWRQRARELLSWPFWWDILKRVAHELLFGWGPRRRGYWVWSDRWQAWEFREFPKNEQLPPHQ